MVTTKEARGGTSEVWLGKTHVLVGVKVGKGRLHEDSPDEGIVMCNAEFTPIANPSWEPGPPPEAAIELAGVVDRGLRSSKMLDTKELNDVISGKVVPDCIL